MGSALCCFRCRSGRSHFRAHHPGRRRRTRFGMARKVSGGALFVEPDLGMYDALTKGIAKAVGDIISHLNSDEQYLPGTLGIVHRFFTRNPEIEVLFGDAILISADGTPLGYRRIVPPLRSHTVSCHLGTLTCSTFFRRSVVERGLSYKSEWRQIGDAALVLSWLDAGIKMAAIHQPLAVFTFTGINLGMGKAAEEEGRSVSSTKRSTVPDRSGYRCGSTSGSQTACRCVPEAESQHRNFYSEFP